MGIVLVFLMIAAAVMLGWLFVHALTADPSPEGHRWLVIVPVLIMVSWVLLELVFSP